MVADVKQLRANLNVDTAVAVSPLAEIENIIVIGQSNAGAGSGSSGPPPIRKTNWPHHNLDSGYYGSFGDTDATASLAARDSLRPAADPAGNGQSPAVMMIDALSDIEAIRGKSQPRAHFTSWLGSTDLDKFFPGTSGYFIHENALA